MTLRTTLALTFLVLAAGCTGIPTGPDTTNTTAPPANGTDVTVVRVIDGDTMDVRYGNGTTERVRLLGVDTPETHADVTPGEWEGVPDSAAGRECLRTWGDRAKQYATDELAGTTVTLVIDPESDVRGGYGRLLGYLAYNGSTFNERLLRTGHARMYDSQFSRRAEFAEMERTAMENETGAWTCRTPTGDGGDGGSGDGGSGDGSGDGSGSDGSGAADAALSIGVHADADGRDGENLNDEYVILTNTGNSSLDLSGWTVTDTAGHSYEFPSLTISPGRSVTLHTGSGSDTDTDVFWGSSQPVWNNGGDEVIVRNAAGDVVARTAY